MKNQNIYLLVGLAWLACCIYQLKNNSMFMVYASAIVSFLCFAFVFYKMYKKDSAGKDNGKTGK